MLHQRRIPWRNDCVVSVDRLDGACAGVLPHYELTRIRPIRGSVVLGDGSTHDVLEIRRRGHLHRLMGLELAYLTQYAFDLHILRLEVTLDIE